MAATATTKPKKYICTHDGCGKGFTRSDHLQRHVLNHGLGESTCPRCSLHFKRPDLLGKGHHCLSRQRLSDNVIDRRYSADRHMARHRQKDEEAGGEGLGVIESRKKLWRDPEGNIVNKRPASVEACKASTKKQATDTNPSGQAVLIDGCNAQAPLHAEPLSPPRSMLSSESFEHFSHQLPELPDDQDFIGSATGQDPTMFDFLANSSWGSTSGNAFNLQGDMPLDDMFNADTGKCSCLLVACQL